MEISNRIWLGAVSVLAALLISTVGIFVWREVRYQDRTTKSVESSIDEVVYQRRLTKRNVGLKEIRQTFPGYFRNAREQEEMKALYDASFDNPTFVETSATETTGTCNLTCDGTREKRSPKIRHGCCESSFVFVSPDEMKNYKGQPRVVVQFNECNQFFMKHKCKKVTGCNGCRCARTDEIRTAVVLKFGLIYPSTVADLEIDWFKFPGCCRCINN